WPGPVHRLRHRRHDRPGSPRAGRPVAPARLALRRRLPQDPAAVTAFELFFSLFGLILGLAVAVVIGGLSDLLRERRRIPIGHLTPMLALFVLFDLSSLWVNTFEGMSDIQVAYGPFVAALVVASAYFFAAGMIFPKTLS